MRIPTSKHSIAVLTVLVAALGACSSGGASSVGESASSTSVATGSISTSAAPSSSSADSSAPASTAVQATVTVEACDLLTPEEVAGVIGDPTQDPEFDDSVDGFFTCSYEGTSGNMLLDVTVYPDVETAKGMFAVGIDMGGNDRIEGPGDEAMSTQPVGDIDVRVGRMEVTIDLFTNDESLDEELAIAKELAATVVTQLGE